jgi:ABC-type uncharacterized transport system permease subunit
MLATLLSITLVLYIVGVFLAVLGTVYRSVAARTGAAAVLIAAWSTHLAAVVLRGLSTGRVPLGGVAEYLLALGLGVMTLYLVVWLAWRVHVAALVLPPLSAIAAFCGMALLPAASTAAPPTPPGWFLFHVTVSTLGMAMLVVALAMSVFYLVQDRGLKSRRTLGLLERLPALERCDQIGFSALLIGFALLTAGILTGVVVNLMEHHRPWIHGTKQTLPVLAWLVLVVIVVARYRLGFRGRKSAYLTIAAVALGLLSVIGMTN